MLNRLVVVTAVAVLVREVAAQDSMAATKPKTAALAGMVRDGFGRGLRDAAVTVDKTELRAVTNDSGLFFLPGIPAGKSDFTVMRLGFGAVHFAIDLAADSTLVVNIPMKNVQALPNVDVKAEQVSAKLLRAGYYERRNLALGSFVGPEKIEKLHWSTVPSTFLRDLRGTYVRCSRGGIGNCKVFMGTARSCKPVIYVDGSKRTGELDEVVDASEVYSMEAYDRRAYVPGQFQPADCAIVVWTKTYADVPLPPKRP
jgi:hypothetical protein